MIDEKFIFVAVALILFGDFTYLVYTIKGRVRPNKVTWFLWALAPLIAFAAEVQQGVGLLSLTTFAFGAVPLFIFFASFLNKKSDWKITKFDLICGVLSLLGLTMWGITRVGSLAILFGIIADGLAAVPTFLKAFKAPETENYKVYLFNAVGAVITLLTIKTWNFTHVAFPLYILLGCFTIFLLIKFKLGKRIQTLLTG